MIYEVRRRGPLGSSVEKEEFGFPKWFFEGGKAIAMLTFLKYE
jgi:hypothetical protein